MPVQFSDERADVGRLAVPGDLPAGEDMRGSPAFEAIETAVRRMDTEGPGAVDWKFVASESLGYLRSQSKDLLVAAWACFALTRLEGYRGLAVGLQVIQGIVDDHWDGCFPPAKRERARVAAIDWLVGRVTPVLSDIPADRADPAAVLAAFDAVAAIETAATVKLQKEQLSLLDLYRLIRPLADEARRAAAEAERRREEEARAAEAVPAAVAEPAPVAGTPAPPSPAVTAQVSPGIGGSADPWTTMLQSARGAAEALRPDVREPRAYLANRIASFLRFDTEPANEGGQCFVAPPADLAARVGDLAAAGQWEAVIGACEGAVLDEPLWLDGHRHSHAALEAIGGAEAAQKAIAAGLALMVQRFPDLVQMRFSDGSPLADAATRAFIASAMGGSGPTGDELAAVVDEARGLAGRGDRDRAFDLLGRLARRQTTDRDGFRARLEQLAFCVDQSQAAAGLSLAEHLTQVVADRDLERWEPDLAARVGELTFRLLMSQEAQYLVPDDKRRSAAQAAAAIVARLDLGMAARLQWA